MEIEELDFYDIYDRDEKRIRENAKKSYPHGASQILHKATYEVINGEGGEGLARAYKRARDDSESLKKRGERERAELVKKQYMQEHFLPAVEIVVNSTSPDELLNSKHTLNLLDQYALLEGSGMGYTASYVRESYKDLLGQVEGRSDPYVKAQMRKLNLALDDGNVRNAFGIAKKLRDQVDKGEHLIDDFDFDLIGRVIAYYG